MEILLREGLSHGRDAQEVRPRLILRSDTMPELHARLLTLASEPPEDEGLSEQAWTLLARSDGWSGSGHCGQLSRSIDYSRAPA